MLRSIGDEAPRADAGYDRRMEQDTAPVDTTPATDDALVEDELLVEEISIDGMCGVY
jgi:mycofactocin precursor